MQEAFVEVERLAIGSIAGHCVVGVSQGQHAGDQGDLQTGELVRVSAAVPALVVVEHAGQDVVKRLDVLKHLKADSRVRLELLELLVGEFSGFAENRLGDADLADVVDESGDAVGASSPSSDAIAAAIIETRSECPRV
ncbi:MAG TPA: hypothetical protein PKB10_00085 [Tepidisphaeraceae bacterium]|nr:hypothetical protein [Tepidisphaeraceae bacterium]